MKRIPVAGLFAISLLCVILLDGCTKDKTPRPAETAQPCDPNKIYFDKAIKPILNSNCAMSGCHDAVTMQDGVNLSTYEGVRQKVEPGRPQDSDIIEMINEQDPEDRMPPPPRSPLSQEQKDLLWNWILQGADNAMCEENGGACSPSNVSFANDIRPIINTNCLGCHNGPSGQKGVDLSTHAGVQSASLGGRLYNAVAQNGQATPMPPNGKLSSCDIQKIKAWVDEGARNN